MNPLSGYAAYAKLIGLGLVIASLMGLGAYGGWKWQDGNVKEAEAARDLAKAEADDAKAANKTNQGTIKDLRTANQKLADERKAQQDAAALAAKQLATIRAELGAQVAKNAALRQKMGEKDAQIRAYLDTGMPCELAVQLWGKQAGYCAD